MNIIIQIFIKNIENTLKIFSEDILSSIYTYVNRSLRYNKVIVPLFYYIDKRDLVLGNRF